jgi:integrase/recombinase XerD
MTSLFEQFLKERMYISNASQNTLEFYRSSFKCYQKFVAGANVPTKQDLNAFVTGMREQGIKPVTCNTYIRGINSFLTWLYENGYTSEQLKIKQLKCEQRVMKTFTEAQLKRLISFKPVKSTDIRTHTLVLLALDTGCRITELLTLKRANIDFDNLLITVYGKGSKERVIPISLEARKMLYKFIKHGSEFVFATRDGHPLMYNNVLRDYKRLLKLAGVEKCDQSFHSLRRAFAKAYVRNGGNLFYLQQTLGHVDLKTTRGYVQVDTEALQEAHMRTSILSKLR